MRNALTPAWATAVAQEVCAQAGKPLPRVEWMRQRHLTSMRRGVTKHGEGSIEIREIIGEDPEVAKTILLHELAHWIDEPTVSRGVMSRSGHFQATGRSRGDPHDVDFYILAARLYRKFGVSLEVACRHEYISGLPIMAGLGVKEAYAEMATRRRAKLQTHPLVLKGLSCGTCGTKISTRIAASILNGRSYHCRGVIEEGA